MARPLGADGGPGSDRSTATLEQQPVQEDLRRDFIANVSHELKSPAGALALLAETMAGEDDPEVLRRLAHRMATEATRLNLMIHDLLDFSRAEVEAPTSVSVDDIVADAIERVGPAAHAHDIRLEVRTTGQTTQVHGSRRQLVSALGNLLENAVKYSSEHSSVELHVGRSTTEVLLQVRDIGMGIPADELPRIFERFYRAEPARTQEGAGLGLAIVRQVAREHGGDVVADSKEGRGSTFTLRLPVKQVIELP